MKKVLPYAIVALITILMLAFPETSVRSAKSALNLCLDVIIPSLFPFFVCSGLLIHSGICRHLASFLEPVMKPVFNVGGCGAAAFVLGTLSGYPQGAITACNLYQSGYLSKSETERLLAFCNNSGPIFVLSAVGIATYSSIKTGIILYISHLIASIIVGVIFRFYRKNSHTAPKYSVNQPDLPFSETFSSVLRDSVSNILTVCGAIVFFGTVSGLILQFFPNDGVVKALFSGILELSQGNRVIADSSLSVPTKLALSAFSVGFAGICVHLQVAAIVSRHHLSLAPYLFGKLLHGLLSAGITLSYLYFSRTSPTFSASDTVFGSGLCLGSLYTTITMLFLTLAGFVLNAKRAQK